MMTLEPRLTCANSAPEGLPSDDDAIWQLSLEMALPRVWTRE